MNTKNILICSITIALSGCETIGGWYLPEEAINSETANYLAPFVHDEQIDISKINFKDDLILKKNSDEVAKARSKLRQAQNKFSETITKWESSLIEIDKARDELNEAENKKVNETELDKAQKKLSLAITTENNLLLKKTQAETDLAIAKEDARNSYIIVRKTSPEDVFKAGIYLSNKSCEVHKAQIRGNMDVWNIATGITSLALAGAAAIVDHSGTASDLAAGAAFVTGSRGIVNSEVYSDSLDGIIISTIDNARETKLDSLQNETPYENLYDAINAVEEYHSVCSLNYALTQIQDALSEKFRQKNKGEISSNISNYEESLNKAYERIEEIKKDPKMTIDNNVELKGLVTRAEIYEKRIITLNNDKEAAKY